MNPSLALAAILWLPPWSGRVIAVIAIALLLLAAVRWRRERRGGGLLTLRALIIALLIFVMLNPQSILPRPRPGKPRLVILLDTSASMATRDVGGDSRFHAAVRALSDPAAQESLNR